jgi:hypothetical protein
MAIPLRQLLERYPLYRRGNATDTLPSKISRACEQCEKETTWGLQSHYPDHDWCFCSGVYRCLDCEKEEVRFFLQRDLKQSSQIMKIGQYPPPSVDIPKALEKGLADSVEHYRKGLICFNQGYGIAATAYFRRVVEERTNDLIDVVAELALANGAEPKDVEPILAAESKRTYDKRLEVASQMIPASLRPGGVNPLGRLHGLLSHALHVQSEGDALSTAEEMRDIIDYVFENMQEYVESQRRYAQKVQRATTAPSEKREA